MLVGQHLADRRLRSGLLAADARRDGAQADEAQQFLGGVEAGQPLAQDRVAHPTCISHEVDQLGAGGTHPPECPAGRQGHPFVAEGDLGQIPSATDLAHEGVGRQAHVGEEHLVEGLRARHLGDGPDVDPGRIHRTHEVGDAPVLGHMRIATSDEDAVTGVLGERRPDLLPVHHPFITVSLGSRAQAGQVAPGAGFTEQLTPDVLTGQQPGQVARLLLVGAGVHEGRACPADPDRVRRSPDPGPTEFLVDHELVHGVGGETPRPREVRRDVASLGQVATGRSGMVVEPVPNLLTARIVLGRQLEVHPCTLGRQDRADPGTPVPHPWPVGPGFSGPTTDDHRSCPLA